MLGRRGIRRRAADDAALRQDYEADVRDRLYGGPRAPAITEVMTRGGSRRR